MGVTILLTIYRRPYFYKEALNSLAKQTDQSFELIIYSNIPVEYDLSKFKDVKVIDSPNTTIAFQTLIDRLNTVYKGIENKRLTRFQTLIDRLNTL